MTREALKCGRRVAHVVEVGMLGGVGEERGGRWRGTYVKHLDIHPTLLRKRKEAADIALSQHAACGLCPLRVVQHRIQKKESVIATVYLPAYDC